MTDPSRFKSGNIEAHIDPMEMEEYVLVREVKTGDGVWLSMEELIEFTEWANDLMLRSGHQLLKERLKE